MTTENRSKSPLLTKQLTSIQNWTQWQEMWAAAHHFEILHSLLHFGFKVIVCRTEDAISRVQFYCSLADGHAYPPDFIPCEPETSKRNRSALAVKAFKVLCLDFLKEFSNNIPAWLKLIGPDQMFASTMFHFFRPIGNSVGSLMNTRGPRLENETKIALNFLSTICQIGLGIRQAKEWDLRSDRFLQQTAEKELQPFLPEIVDTLYGIEELDVLLDDQVRNLSSIIPILERKVLQKPLRLPSEKSDHSCERKPKTIEEAVYGDSKMASILLTLRVRQKQSRHWQQIREAEEQKRSAENKLAALKKD